MSAATTRRGFWRERFYKKRVTHVIGRLFFERVSKTFLSARVEVDDGENYLRFPLSNIVPFMLFHVFLFWVEIGVFFFSLLKQSQMLKTCCLEKFIRIRDFEHLNISWLAQRFLLSITSIYAASYSRTAALF